MVYVLFLLVFLKFIVLNLSTLIFLKKIHFNSSSFDANFRFTSSIENPQGCFGSDHDYIMSCPSLSMN